MGSFEAWCGSVPVNARTFAVRESGQAQGPTGRGRLSLVSRSRSVHQRPRTRTGRSTPRVHCRGDVGRPNSITNRSVTTGHEPRSSRSPCWYRWLGGRRDLRSALAGTRNWIRCTTSSVAITIVTTLARAAASPDLGKIRSRQEARGLAPKPPALPDVASKTAGASTRSAVPRTNRFSSRLVVTNRNGIGCVRPGQFPAPNWLRTTCAPRRVRAHVVLRCVSYRRLALPVLPQNRCVSCHRIWRRKPAGAVSGK